MAAPGLEELIQVGLIRLQPAALKLQREMCWKPFKGLYKGLLKAFKRPVEGICKTVHGL
jgi:hypothetical protein